MKVKIKTKFIYEFVRYAFGFFGILGFLQTLTLGMLNWPPSTAMYILILFPFAIFTTLSILASFLVAVNPAQKPSLSLEDGKQPYLRVKMSDVELVVPGFDKASLEDLLGRAKSQPKPKPSPPKPPKEPPQLAVTELRRPDDCLGKLGILAEAGKFDPKNKAFRYCVTECPKLIECVGDHCYGLLAHINRIKKVELTDPKFEECRKCKKVIKCLGI